MTGQQRNIVYSIGIVIAILFAIALYGYLSGAWDVQ